MVATINADTTNGVIITSDTSGEIKLQSAGADIATVSSTGITMASGKTLPASALTGALPALDGSSLTGIASSQWTTSGSNIYYTTGCVTINTTIIPTVTYGVAKFVVGDSGGNAYGTITEGGIYEGKSGSTIGQAVAFWRNPNGIVGSINTSGTSTSYATSSDYRLKENVAPMSGSIDRLKQLKPSTWSWIHGGNGEGFLAHEAQEVVPESITGTKDEVDNDGNPVYQGIDQSKLVPLLTAALQEAITKIEDLETRIQALESK